MKKNDLISRSALLEEIERQQSIMHHCDRLEVDNVKQLIADAPAVDNIKELRALIETDIATGMIPASAGSRLLRYVLVAEQ